MPALTWNTPSGRDWLDIARAALGPGRDARSLAQRLRLRHEGACLSVKVEDGAIDVLATAPSIEPGWERLD